MMHVVQFSLFARCDGRWEQAEGCEIIAEPGDVAAFVGQLLGCGLQTAGADDFQHGEGSIRLVLNVIPTRDMAQVEQGIRSGVKRAWEGVMARPMTDEDAEKIIEDACQEEDCRG